MGTYVGLCRSLWRSRLVYLVLVLIALLLLVQLSRVSLPGRRDTQEETHTPERADHRQHRGYRGKTLQRLKGEEEDEEDDVVVGDSDQKRRLKQSERQRLADVKIAELLELRKALEEQKKARKDAERKLQEVHEKVNGAAPKEEEASNDNDDLKKLTKALEEEEKAKKVAQFQLEEFGKKVKVDAENEAWGRTRENMFLAERWWRNATGKDGKPLDHELLRSLQRNMFLSQYWKKFGQGPITADVNEWWQAAAMIDWFIEGPVDMSCADHRAMGNWHVCMDPPYTVKAPCLVYSFGIGNDFSFDDAMGKLGCEVHSFDPSMGREDHRRSDRVTFHNLGLSDKKDDTFSARHDVYVHSQQNWKMLPLDDVIRDLNHTGRTIDVLKIDVEGHEWAVVKDLLNKNIMTSHVRHFMLEWHLFADWPDKKDYVALYQVYKSLRESGFADYFKSPHPKNLDPANFNIQGDIEFVNTKLGTRS